MPALDDIYARYKEHGVRSVFLYTQEAHPGENYPHLTSMEQKFQHAEDFRDKVGVGRPILVDSLEGDCHWAYGSEANMTWIISGAGLPVYKAEWTDPSSIENALEYFVEVDVRRERGEAIVPFPVVRLDYREHDVDAIYRGLEVAGPKAVAEFERAFGR